MKRVVFLVGIEYAKSILPELSDDVGMTARKHGKNNRCRCGKTRRQN